MVGTFKLNGKKVSERNFKRAVFGKDSKQAKAAAKKADARDNKRRGFSGTRERREVARAAESQKSLDEKNAQGIFSSNQTVKGTVPLAQAPPQRVTRERFVETIKTPINSPEAELSPQEIVALNKSRKRNKQIKEDIREATQAEINKGVNPSPQIVGQTIQDQRNAPLPQNPFFSFAKTKLSEGLTFAKENIDPSFADPNATQFKDFRKEVKATPDKLITFSDRQSQKFEKKEKTAKNLLQTVEFGTETFVSGAVGGVGTIGNLIVNPERDVFPFLAAATTAPVSTFNSVYEGLGTVGDKVRVAGTAQTGAFASEFAASGGLEFVGARFVLAPLKNKVITTITKLSPDYRPVIERPVTTTVDVNPFTRATTRQRKAGEALPDNYVFATDDLVVTENKVQGFKRTVKTGETEFFIENVPSSKEPFDIKLVGGTASNAEDLATQLGKSGTTRDLVSAQTNLIQKGDTIFPTNAADFIVNKPSDTPLERSLFFSSEPELRQSRFKLSGDSKLEPNFIDIATEDFNTKNEVLFKPQTEIAAFPDNLQPAVDFIGKIGRQREGETVRAAVQRARTATAQKFPSFERDLLKFQLETQGKPTVPGFVSSEQEAVFTATQAARGERAGVTVIQNTRVKLFEEVKLQPSTPLSKAAIDNLLQDQNLVSSNADAALNNLLTPRTTRPTSPAFNNPVFPKPVASRSSTPSRETPTTSSFTGLEVRSPSASPIVATRAPSRDLNRGFIPRTTFSPAASPTTRTPISSSPPPFFPSRPPRRSGSSRSPSPIVSLPRSPILSPPPRTPARSPFRSPPPPPRTTRTPFLTPFRFKPQKKREGSFTTQVLQKGKFVTVGRSTSLKNAFTRGSLTVGSKALRSFRVLKGASVVSLAPTSRFRRSKSKSNTLVEKSRFSINTPGEVFEIGGAAKRKRKRGFLL